MSVEDHRRGMELGDLQPGHFTIVNDTELPDGEVEQAVQTYFAENASMAGVANSTFGTYANEGSMLARTKYRVPTTVIEEIKLARDLADRDDDVGAVLGTMIGAAFADGMRNLHKDEKTAGYFDEIAREANLDGRFKEMYREYLIAASVTTLSAFTRSTLTYTPTGTGRKVSKGITYPLIGVLHAEQIRVLDDDTFGAAPLWYVPAKESQAKWLEEFFNPQTSEPRRAELRRQQPVWAVTFVEQRRAPDTQGFIDNSMWVYRLNPSMVDRTTMPKGSYSYARPLLTRDFGLLEAKRLLNIMDYSLLQGGTNYIVIVRKGSDQRPATQSEVNNLFDVVRRASKTGVLVGDHRLQVDVVTPKLDELLNPGKRNLIGRKLAMGLMRLPERATQDPGAEGAKGDMTLMERVITGDRNDLDRHVERIYARIEKRNSRTFTEGTPSIWHPKLVLSGQDAFNQYVVKLRDRGDIPRRWAVEAAGFNYDASVEQRRREIANGDDEVLTPGNVPFDAPGDQGRPPGSSQSNGRPGGPPNQDRPTSNPQTRRLRAVGETIRAWYDEEAEAVHRVGDLTYAVLESFPDREIGRMTGLEKKALDAEGVTSDGPLAVVPVNIEYACDDFKAVRLAEGLSMIVGRRKLDGAIVARALCFREPQYDLKAAEDHAVRWGFPLQPATEIGD